MSEDLIAQLEKATGPDRDLDRTIARLCNKPAEWVRDTLDGEEIVRDFDMCAGFTSSVDAALELVPAAHEWRIGNDAENRRGWAVVGSDVWDECNTEIAATATTPALALCIAALRARATQEK